MYDGYGTGLFAWIMYIIFYLSDVSCYGSSCINASGAATVPLVHISDLELKVKVLQHQLCNAALPFTPSTRFQLRKPMADTTQMSFDIEWKTALSCRRFFSTHCRRESYTSLDTCARSALTTVDNVNTSSLCVNHVNSRCEQLHEMIWWISHMQDHPSF